MAQRASLRVRHCDDSSLWSLTSVPRKQQPSSASDLPDCWESDYRVRFVDSLCLKLLSSIRKHCKQDAECFVWPPIDPFGTRGVPRRISPRLGWCKTGSTSIEFSPSARPAMDQSAKTLPWRRTCAHHAGAQKWAEIPRFAPAVHACIPARCRCP